MSSSIYVPGFEGSLLVASNIDFSKPTGSGTPNVTNLGQILMGSGQSGSNPEIVPATVVAGSGITVTPALGSPNTLTIAATGGGSGTVTSVAMTVPSFLSVAGSPVTTSGTLAVSLSGSALPVSSGGTGDTTLTANGILYGNGTGAIGVTSPGTAGQVLTSNGSGSAPTYQTPSAGGVTSVNTATGAVVLQDSGQGIFTFTPSGSNVNVSSSVASTSQIGAVTLASNAQAIAGTDAANAVTSAALAAKLGAQTVHGVALGEGSSSALGFTSAGSTGQVLIGLTGSDPSFGALGVNSGLAAHSVIISEGTSAFVAVGSVTSGAILQSTGAGSDPAFSSASYPSSTTANQLLYSSSSNTVTGLTSGSSGVLTTDLTGVPSFTGPLSNGQLIIGSTGAQPVAANLSAGSGVTIVNAAGSITISSPSVVTWQSISASQAMVSNNGYLVAGGAVSLSLPASSNVGDVIYVSLAGGTSWSISQGAGQSITVGNLSSTVGVGGSLSSTSSGDGIMLVCSQPSLAWIAPVGPIGNLSLV